MRPATPAVRTARGTQPGDVRTTTTAGQTRMGGMHHGEALLDPSLGPPATSRLRPR